MQPAQRYVEAQWLSWVFVSWFHANYPPSPFLFLSLSVHPFRIQRRNDIRTSVAGSRYSCGWVDRGSLPSDLIHTERPTQPPFRHRYITQKAFNTLVFPTFDSCLQMDGRTDWQTDRPTEGQSHLVACSQLQSKCLWWLMSFIVIYMTNRRHFNFSSVKFNRNFLINQVTSEKVSLKK